MHYDVSQGCSSHGAESCIDIRVHIFGGTIFGKFCKGNTVDSSN